MMLVSFVSYVDRTALALLAPTILVDLRLSAEQYGWVISAFSVCYTVSNPIWGFALDRIGLRFGLTAAVAIWTVASMSHALAGGLLGLAAARALLGLGEGATFPGGLRATTHTLPLHLRSRGVAIAYGGGSLGAVITPLIVTPIALAFGWRGAFLATGLLGAAWIALWLLIAPGSEKAGVPGPQVRGAPGPQAMALARPVAMPSLLDARLAGFVALYAMGGLPLGFVLYAAPLYLARALGQSQQALGTLLWIPPLGWELGYLATGWVTDRVVRSDAARRSVVSLPMLIGAALVGMPLAVARWLPGLALPMTAFFLATFSAGSLIIQALTYATREFGTGRAGLLAGLGAGTWSALVALVMPAYGRLFDHGHFGTAFALAGMAQTTGVLFWLGAEAARGRRIRRDT
jgi:ACS family hexuronate transporter-like MFS transporter